ncbi:MAG: M20/M25/M40 family metallo-hydrolase [Tannerella sp.]|jgi:Zn-dependent M28 family amino/carboxypeptidase|nr:M20/M25/M40 family metallo-hydrolase [Tannerella sp.]
MKHLLFLLFIPSLMWSQVIDNRDANLSRAINDISIANMRQTVDDLVGFHTRNNFSSKTDTKKGIGAAATYLYKRLAEYAKTSDGRLEVEMSPYKATVPRSEDEIELVNVIATIRGNDSRVIALLAHYDNRGGNGNDGEAFAPGANDDGSGVAALLEIARILSKQPLGATLKLMFVSGEEHGLWGARHQAKIAAEQQWSLIAVINNDMIGNAEGSQTGTHDNTTIRVFSEGIPVTETDAQRQQRSYNSAENDSPSRQLARYIKEIGERYVDNMTVQLIYRNDRFGRGGDHTPFAREGFAAVRMTEVNENYDRTHQDVGERDGIRFGDMPWGIDWEYLRKNTAVNLSTAANLALAPYVPENVRIANATRLTNIVEIEWQTPQQGKKPKGYYVLVRQTDVSTWQRKIFIADTRIALPLSKDNYFFAVQSVDEEGHESLPVFAVGVR